MSSRELLFIEPQQPASPTPVIDHITRRMCAAFRQARDSDYACGGHHRCICGATSADHDFYLPNGDLTNSLCVHYVAYHRSEVPQQELARIEAFTSGEVEPTLRELELPCPIHDALPGLVELPTELRQAFKELDAQIEVLNQQKNAAVAEFDFERAACFRDKADRLKQDKAKITREWRQSSAGNTAE
jgi:hypothetical protein